MNSLFKTLTMFVLSNHSSFLLYQETFDVAQDFDFMFSWIKALSHDVDVKRFQLRFHHEFVVTNTDGSDSRKCIQLNFTLVMTHEVKHGPEYFFHSLISMLKRQTIVEAIWKSKSGCKSKTYDEPFVDFFFAKVKVTYQKSHDKHGSSEFGQAFG